MHVDQARLSDAEAIEILCREADVTVDVRAELSRPFSRIWLARSSPREAPVALLVAWEVAGELHVQDVATRPEARRRGAARTLLRYALSEARDRGHHVALLEVRKTNHAARQLYESVGFSGLRERSGYYADGEDALEMGCDLREVPHRVVDGSVNRAEAQ